MPLLGNKSTLDLYLSLQPLTMEPQSNWKEKRKKKRKDKQSKATTSDPQDKINRY